MSPNQIPGVSGLRRRVDEAIRWRAAIAIDEARMGFNERIERAEAKAEWTANEMRRLAPQLAAVEQRLADLETRVAAGGQGHVDDEAVAALQQVRAEHERVRARLSGVALYEERLRRLETASGA